MPDAPHALRPFRSLPNRSGLGCRASGGAALDAGPLGGCGGIEAVIEPLSEGLRRAAGEDSREGAEQLRSHPDLDLGTDAAADPVEVLVARNERGGWEVAVPAGDARLTCETLDDARRVAYLCAARTGPCEVIVHDAYHRVLYRELIDGDRA